MGRLGRVGPARVGGGRGGLGARGAERQGGAGSGRPGVGRRRAALGASHRRAWRQLVWPIVRPEVARTSAAVFAATLLDPGAPIVLGQRRTLAFLIVETTLRRDAPTRAAMLALIGLAWRCSAAP